MIDEDERFEITDGMSGDEKRYAEVYARREPAPKHPWSPFENSDGSVPVDMNVRYDDFMVYSYVTECQIDTSEIEEQTL